MGVLLNPRGNWPFTPAEDIIVARRRFRGVPAKVVADELGRTPASINHRFHALKAKLAAAHADILENHRREELELLERLLDEARAPEMYRNEVL